MASTQTAAGILTRVKLAGLVFLLSSCVTDREPVNVVLVSVDTLSFSALRAFSSDADPHPHFDGFAKQSRIFSRAHATASWTLPSQASLLTGLYPDRHGAVAHGHHIRDEAPRLAVELAERGFATVGCTDGGYVHHSLGFRKGFGRYDEWASSPDWEKLRFPRNGYPHEVRGGALFDRAIAFLGRRTTEAPPFFLYVQTYAVHAYFDRHPWTQHLWKGRPPEKPGGYVDCIQGKEECTDGEWRLLESLYRAEVHHLDGGFGRFLDALSRAGVRESTLVIVVSDHGEGFEPQRGRIHHGGRLHADQLRVPLMMQGPGIEPGVSSEPVSLVDVMPTILDWLDLPEPEGLDGRSLVAALRGGTLETRPLYAFEYAYLWEDGRRLDLEAKAEPVLRAVIGEDHWYIQDERADELYRTADDPRQMRNLAPDTDLEAVQRLAALRGNLDSISSAKALDPELEKELRALGYLE